jgi:hypothetical protein
MSASGGRPIVEATGLTRTYAADGVPVRAVDGVDLAVEAGETESQSSAGVRPPAVADKTVTGRFGSMDGSL